MAICPQRRSFSKRSPRTAVSPRSSIGVLVFLALFVTQLSLSLLLYPMTQILCLEELSRTGDAAAHSHHHDGETAPEQTESPDSALEHCKEAIKGVALTTMQPFSLPAAFRVEPPASARRAWVAAFEPLTERAVPPPFQPPRA